MFVDDDVEASLGWLAALLTAAREHPSVDVFAGQIRPRLEGRPPRTCGGEGSPITTLDLGERDAEARYAWGANMTIRRAALERVGAFDVTLEQGGDEQEWQDRLRACEPGARVLYVAGAAVDHRRTGADARLRALTRTAYARGRAARRFDARRGQAPPAASELRTLVGCAWHVVRRRCPAGLTMVAHSAGRVREAMRERIGVGGGAAAAGGGAPGEVTPGMTAASNGTRTAADPAATMATDKADKIEADFLSGHSGTVGGLDTIVRDVRDAATDAWEIASARRYRLDLAARHDPPLRRVLAIGVVRPEHATAAARVRAELERSRHEVELHTCPPGGMGKFENLNRLLAERGDGTPVAEHDWLLVVDDDIELPRGFLDRVLFLCERFRPAAGPAGAPSALARGLAGYQAPVGERRARDAFRGDRPRDRVRAGDIRGAAAVSAAAHGLGTGRALGRARARAWLALWRARRRGDRPSRDPRRRRLLARGGGERGARVPRRATVFERERIAANPDDAPSLVKVAVVAEFYPSRRDPVLGVWAHRQALAARDAGAEVRVLVLHRLIPPRVALRAGPDALARELSARVREPRSQTRDGLEVSYVSYVSPPRARSYAGWGAWAAPALGLALRRLRRSFGYELVHAHNAVPAGDAVRRARMDVPLVVSVHGGDVLYTAAPPPLGGPGGAAAVARGLGAARLTLANSQGIAELCRAHGAGEVRVVHLGADLLDSPRPRGARVRRLRS